MDLVKNLFLEALKSSLKNKSVKWDREDLQPKDWINLFQLAESHHVLPMIYEAVYNCPAAKKTESQLFAAYKKRTMQQVMLQTMKTSEFLCLYQYLKRSGVTPIVVKGIICRELYKNPDYRLSGDEDILISSDQFQLCYDAMMSYGMSLTNPEQEIHTAYEVPFGRPGSPIYIELHKSLFPPDSEAYGDLNCFFEHVWNRKIELPIQGIHVSAMNHTDHLFYLICHSFKHFLHSGFGIRQVCDITLYANVYGQSVDWHQMLNNCRKINAEFFAAALFRIGQKYLTFDPGAACYPDEWKAIKVDETELLEDLLNSGIYGDANMSRKHSSNITLNAVSAQKKGKGSGGLLVKTVFPPAKDLEGRYPCLKRHPYLLPIVWVNRILKYKKEISQVTDNDAASSIQIGTQRIELMKKYGIIKDKAD